MLSVIISSVIIAYAIYNLININRFIINAESERYSCTESLIIIGIYIWLICNFFLISGPIVLLFTFFILVSQLNDTVKFIRLFFILLIIVSIIITLNDLYFKINMWKYIFQFLTLNIKFN